MKITLYNQSSFNKDSGAYELEFSIWYETDEKISECKGGKSSSSTTSNSSTSTQYTTENTNTALDDISTSEGVQVSVTGGGTVNVDQPLTTELLQNSADFMTSQQAFLGETFSTALNFVSQQSTNAYETVAGRDLGNDGVSVNPEKEQTKLLMGLGIVVAGVVAYNAIK